MAKGEGEGSGMVFREVTRDTWGDFERLFESRGGPKSCWCMIWRATGAESRHPDGASRKAAMKKRVKAGGQVGILGYLGGEPVAWCSIAPRETYRSGLADVREGDDEETVWSLVCFFITRSARGQGVLKQLIEKAKAHARAHGATVLEAYPVDEDSPSYRFGGFLPAFEKAGFELIGHAGTRRHVVRYRLDALDS
jgi:GNAT superfamily N-acetyltransferase